MTFLQLPMPWSIAATRAHDFQISLTLVELTCLVTPMKKKSLKIGQ